MTIRFALLPSPARLALATVPAGRVHVLVCSTALVTTPLASVNVVRQRNVAVGSGEVFVQRKLKVSGEGVALV
jgi:hypothetical protein